MAARIWYQSFVHPVQQAPYIERLQALLNEVAGPDARFEVHGLDPPDHSFHPLTEFRYGVLLSRRVYDGSVEKSVTLVVGLTQRF